MLGLRKVRASLRTRRGLIGMVRKTERLSVVERVRCLDCGASYAKPNGGGTTRSNPGCPSCGYVGWVAEAVPVMRAVPRRFAVGQLPPQPARSG